MAIDLVNKIHDGRAKQHQEHRGQAERNLMAGDGDVGRNLPATFAFVFDPQNEHSQAVEGETPDHPEGIRFAQQVDVAVAHQNGEQLQKDNQVDDAIGSSEAGMRLAEPIGENAVFRHAVEDAVGADDRGVDRAGQDQETHDYDEGAEKQLQQQWARRFMARPAIRLSL